MSENNQLWANVHQASKIFILPNFFTAGNLFFGFLSTICCMSAQFQDARAVMPGVKKLASFIFPNIPETASDTTFYYAMAILCILASFFCDALDGRVARAIGKSSLFGKEFDSVADSLSFGLAPAMLMYFLVLQPTAGMPQYIVNFLGSAGLIIGFLFLLCAGIRLARFNVLTNPYIVGHEKYEKGDFSGLPAPAAAGAVASISLTMLSLDLTKFAVVLVPLMVLIAWFMISNIPYPSFKHINWNTSARFRTFVLIIAAILLIFAIKEYSFAIMFLAYVFYSPIKYLPRVSRIFSYIRKRGLKKVSENAKNRR